MDFEKICKQRFSVRSFSDRKPDEKIIEKLCGLARLSPTAKNNQPYELYVISEEKSLKKLETAKACIYGAPVAIVVCSDKEKAWRNRYSGQDSTLQDVGIVATTLLYGAEEYGLNGIYICNFDPQATKTEFSMEENLTPECIIAVGYKTDDCVPSERHFERRELNEFVHYEKD